MNAIVIDLIGFEVFLEIGKVGVPSLPIRTNDEQVSKLDNLNHLLNIIRAEFGRYKAVQEIELSEIMYETLIYYISTQLAAQSYYHGKLGQIAVKYQEASLVMNKSLTADNVQFV